MHLEINGIRKTKLLKLSLLLETARVLAFQNLNLHGVDNACFVGYDPTHQVASYSHFMRWRKKKTVHGFAMEQAEQPKKILHKSSLEWKHANV